jgi:branched-chain amino acid transport system substrate-binding protein
VNKKVIFGVIAVVLVVGLGVFLLGKQEKIRDAVKIGVNLPLTGGYAYWGEEFKRGLDLYHVNQDSTYLKFFIEDNQGKPANAVSATKKLITINNVDAVLTMFAPFSYPLRDLSTEYKVPVISTFNTVGNFTEGFPYCFHDYLKHKPQLQLLADYILEQKFHKGVSICLTDEYGTEGAKVFKELFSEHGGKIAEELMFNYGSISDVRNMVLKSLAPNPDFIFLIAKDRDLISIINNIRERNLNIPVFGLGTFDAPTIWEGIPPEYQKNIFFTSSYFDKDANEQSRLFFDSYTKRYNKQPDAPAVFAYTICQYVSNAIRNAKNSDIDILNELSNVNYESIRGHLMMNDSRNVSSATALYHRNNNQSEVIKVVEQ